MIRAIIVGLTTLGVGTGVLAQERPKPLGKALEVGAQAPGFSLSGATKEGVLPNPVRLEDFRGQTVVLAFFYKARTGG